MFIESFAAYFSKDTVFIAVIVFKEKLKMGGSTYLFFVTFVLSLSSNLWGCLLCYLLL